MRGHFEIVKYLIVKGADLNARDKDHSTPPTKASEYGHIQI